MDAPSLPPIPNDLPVRPSSHLSQWWSFRTAREASPLPDLFVGAHAAVAGHRLLTRGASRYRTCFPKLELIAPA